MEKEMMEQPIVEPANTLNKVDDNEAVSEIGSLETNLGKFKNPEALLDAYNNLQSEFTKKCQLLSKLEKDKAIENELSSNEDVSETDEKTAVNDNEKLHINDDEELQKFLIQNGEAEEYKDEIKNDFNLNENVSPYQKAWASVVLSHLKNNTNKENDPIINQYVLSDENVKNKIIENYLNELQGRKTPYVISSQSGERLSGLKPDNPKTLEEAKILTSKMFS